MHIYKTNEKIQIMAEAGKYLTLAAKEIEDKHKVLCKLVHIPLTESTGDWTEIGEDEAERIRTAKRAASGQAEIQLAQFTQQKKLMSMTINTMALTDEQALEVKDLFPQWADLVGQTVKKDFKMLYEGNLYKVLQEHTVQEQWKPGTDTASLYALVGTDIPEEGEHAGTKEDPIPYEQMMLIEKDKYYTQDGVLYVGIMDANTGFPNDLKDLATLVQRVEE